LLTPTNFTSLILFILLPIILYLRIITEIYGMDLFKVVIIMGNSIGLEIDFQLWEYLIVQKKLRNNLIEKLKVDCS